MNEFLFRDFKPIVKAGQTEAEAKWARMMEVATREYGSGPSFHYVLANRDHLVSRIESRVDKNQDKEQLVVNLKLAIPIILERSGAFLEASKLPQEKLNKHWEDLLDISYPMGPTALLNDPETITKAAPIIAEFKDDIRFLSDKIVTREGIERVLYEDPYNIHGIHPDLTRLLVFQLNEVSKDPKIVGITHPRKPYNPWYTLFKKDVECSSGTINMLRLLST